jgi:hypothetical protein
MMQGMLYYNLFYQTYSVEAVRISIRLDPQEFQ